MANIAEQGATCKDCLHVDVCIFRDASEDEKICSQFINKADVVEVRHGEWVSELVTRCDWRGKKQKYYQPNSCNLCHTAVYDRTDYCPHCGAFMVGKGEQDETDHHEGQADRVCDDGAVSGSGRQGYEESRV